MAIILNCARCKLPGTAKVVFKGRPHDYVLTGIAPETMIVCEECGTHGPWSASPYKAVNVWNTIQTRLIDYGKSIENLDKTLAELEVEIEFEIPDGVAETQSAEHFPAKMPKSDQENRENKEDT